MSVRLKEILSSHVGPAGDPKDKLLGVACIVLDREGIVFQGGCGHQTFAKDSPAYATETVTWIASMTKLLTATSVLQLVEKGVITLDEDVKPRVETLQKMQILKGFTEDGKPILEDNTKPITLRHLLTHTSGLCYDLAEPDIIRWAKSIGREANSLSWNYEGFTTPLVFPPGEGWLYGTSVDWAGHVLAKVTGQSLSEYMDENIFKPLGLTDTTFYTDKHPELKGCQAEFGYRSPATDGNLAAGPPPVPSEYEFESGGAGLYSSAADYAKVLQATLKGDVLLKKETTELLFKPQLNDMQRKAATAQVAAAPNIFAPEYPLGTPLDFTFGGMVNTEDIPGKRSKGSAMWSGFANGHWWIDREAGIAGVLLTTVLCEPVGDPNVVKLYDELETAVYKDITSRAHI